MQGWESVCRGVLGIPLLENKQKVCWRLGFLVCARRFLSEMAPPLRQLRKAMIRLQSRPMPVPRFLSLVTEDWTRRHLFINLLVRRFVFNGTLIIGEITASRVQPSTCWDATCWHRGELHRCHLCKGHGGAVAGANRVREPWRDTRFADPRPAGSH